MPQSHPTEYITKLHVCPSNIKQRKVLQRKWSFRGACTPPSGEMLPLGVSIFHPAGHGLMIEVEQIFSKRTQEVNSHQIIPIPCHLHKQADIYIIHAYKTIYLVYQDPREADPRCEELARTVHGETNWTNGKGKSAV